MLSYFFTFKEANPSLEANLERVTQDAYRRALWHDHVETDIVEGVFSKTSCWPDVDFLEGGRTIEDFEPQNCLLMVRMPLVNYYH